MFIPEKVEIKGDIEFRRYLSIDGQFEGNIITDGGNLMVGQNGHLICDLKNMGTVVIEGKVMGSIQADRLILRGHASVTGDVTCSSVEMGPQSTMIGKMKSIYEPAQLQSPLKTESTSVKAIMFILDPQMDFHQGGSCAIKGADDNSVNIAKFIQTNKESIQDIFVGTFFFTYPTIRYSLSFATYGITFNCFFAKAWIHIIGCIYLMVCFGLMHTIKVHHHILLSLLLILNHKFGVQKTVQKKYKIIVKSTLKN